MNASEGLEVELDAPEELEGGGEVVVEEGEEGLDLAG